MGREPEGFDPSSLRAKTKLALVFPSKRRRGVGVADAFPPGSPLIQDPLGLFLVLVWSVFKEDAPDDMWEDLGRKFGLEHICSVDL